MKRKGPGRPRKQASNEDKKSLQTLSVSNNQSESYDQSSDGESVENKRKASQTSV